MTLLLPTETRAQGSRLDPRVLRCVVRITVPATAWAQSTFGTAFVLSRPRAAPADTGRLLFLVTNKHMVSDWTLADGTATSYRPYLDATLYPEASGPPVTSRIRLLGPDGALIPKRLWLHPDPTVDIALIFLGPGAFETPAPPLDSFDTSFLLPFDQIQAWAVGLGDQVFALGYPRGVTSVLSSEPIAKGGYLATRPGVPFALDIRTKPRTGVEAATRVHGTVLLVDGLITNGNSGGPVVLASDLKVRRDPTNKQLQFFTEQPQNRIIGIVSMSLDTSGLTLVYASDFIIAGLDAFCSQLGATA